MLLVSLTTTAQRLPLCRMALMSIATQTCLPDKIIVWVSDQPYLRDTGIADPAVLETITGDLGALADRVEFRWTENQGPYRKLMPLLRVCEDEDLIVTADDDIFYGREWLATLVAGFDSDKRQVPAIRVRAVRHGPTGKPRTYLSWPIITEPGVRQRDLIITFGGGAVLKKDFFASGDLDNQDYMRVAPTADDLWYSRLLLNNGVSVRCLPGGLDELGFVLHGEGLRNDNLPRVRNFIHLWKWRLIDKPREYLGYPVCENDWVYRRIQAYFNDKPPA